MLLKKSLLERADEVSSLIDRIAGNEESERAINITDGSRRDLLFVRDSINRVKREIDIVHKKAKEDTQ